MTQDRNLPQDGGQIGDHRAATDHLDLDRDTHLASTNRADAHQAAGRDGELTLHAEQLVADVERHEWSRVRVSKRIVHEERTITVPVRREEIVIEYLGDEAAPKGHPDTVRGSTDTVDSRVAAEYVLYEEVPQVELVAQPREKVQVIVDTQRAMVQISDTLRREEAVVEGDEHVAGNHGLTDGPHDRRI